MLVSRIESDKAWPEDLTDADKVLVAPAKGLASGKVPQPVISKKNNQVRLLARVFMLSADFMLIATVMAQFNPKVGSSFFCLN